MNRRTFLKSIAIAVLASRFPGIAQSADHGEWLSIDDIKRAVQLLNKNAVAGPYVAVMHPSMYEDLMESMTPKDRWRVAYREARMELHGMAKRFMESGHVGSYDNVRFVVTA